MGPNCRKRQRQWLAARNTSTWEGDVQGDVLRTEGDVQGDDGTPSSDTVHARNARTSPS